MTDTTRDLIQQLTDGLDTWLMAYPDVQPARHYRYGVDLLAKARAYLDQPEPEELTDEELLQIAAATIDPYEDGIAIGAYEAETECAIEAYGSELIAFARAVLARWGRALENN